MSQRIAVKPITVGYAFSFSLDFTAPGGGAPAGFDLTTAQRVYGEFRARPIDTGAPLAAIDTADGTLVVVDANTISFSIPAAKTAAMIPGKAVWLDFARRDAGVWSPIPVRIAWPVQDAVTIPPA